MKPVDNNFVGPLLPSTTILESLHGNVFSMSGTMEKSQANFFLPPALIFPSYEVKHAQRGAIFIYRTLQTIIEWSEI
jgi:hypothetical protein